MKVLLITHSTGHPETVCSPGVNDQIAELQKMGVSLDVWTIRVGDKLSYLKNLFKVLGLNFTPRRYDLVHATYSLNGLIALMQWKSPVIVTLLGSDLVNKEHGDFTGERDSFIGRLVARFANRIIVQTAEMAAAVPDSADRVDIIPYGINTGIFHPMPVEAARHELELPLDSKIILFPYDPDRSEKQFHLLEKAVEFLRNNFPVQLIPVYGRPRQILALYMNACDVLAMVSSHEGSPVAVREALACGLPVVSAPVGDVPDLISTVDGCHICTHDPADIADKIGRVLQSGRRIVPPETAVARNAAWSAGQIMEIYAKVVRS